MKKAYIVRDRQERSDERDSYLQMTGYQVTQLASSKELLDACRSARPDLVILDALIPGKNGFATAADLRQLLGPDLPLILCSRIYKGDAFREEAARIGCNGFLSMPVPMGEFLACVQTVGQGSGQDSKQGGRQGEDQAEAA